MVNMRLRTLPISLSWLEARLIFGSLALLSFAIPFFLSGSQLITGTIVNMLLFSSAIFLPRKLFLPIIVFPSLGALSRGLLFGPLNPFLVYFLPFIWLGNLTLVSVFKKTHFRLGYWRAVFLASLAKLIILYLFAHLFFRLALVPAVFLTIMGINQLITACLGGFFAFLVFKKIKNEKI
jgi:hypothetical protein